MLWSSLYWPSSHLSSALKVSHWQWGICHRGTGVRERMRLLATSWSALYFVPLVELLSVFCHLTWEQNVIGHTADLLESHIEWNTMSLRPLAKRNGQKRMFQGGVPTVLGQA
eukprot:1459450-Amphidinium_carterae.1